MKSAGMKHRMPDKRQADRASRNSSRQAGERSQNRAVLPALKEYLKGAQNRVQDRGGNCLQQCFDQWPRQFRQDLQKEVAMRGFASQLRSARHGSSKRHPCKVKRLLHRRLSGRAARPQGRNRAASCSKPKCVLQWRLAPPGVQEAGVEGVAGTGCIHWLDAECLYAQQRAAVERRAASTAQFRNGQRPPVFKGSQRALGIALTCDSF